MLLSQELTELLKTEIAVIMNDGMAYRGQLEKFDNEVIVLKNVYETSNQEIDWVESDSNSPSGTTSIRGYVPWRRITLPRLIIRIQMVLRIWPWAPQEPVTPKKTVAAKTKSK